MKIKYQWKQISGDGLLKDVEYRSGYYDRSLNDWGGGYDTEQEAEEALVDAIASASSPFDIPYELVLIKIYVRER